MLSAMGGSIHNDVARFQQGEGRMVYARFRSKPDARPYFLEDGTAGQPGRREFVREELECVMPECTDRRLRLVDRHRGQNQRRDGFSHYPGSGAHSPESLFHVQAKLLIQRWLHQVQPELAVRVEQSTRDRARRADVMATWPDGRQVAIEVQYSALSNGEWLTRHESYRNEGITDIWLFGNGYPHFQTSYRIGTEPAVRMSDLYRTCVEEAVGVFWLNPIDGTVATPFCLRRIEGKDDSWQVAPTLDDRLAEFRLEPLDADCELDPDRGLLTPTRRALMVSTPEYHEAKREADEAEQRRLEYRFPRSALPSDPRTAARGRTSHFDDRPRRPPLTREQLEAKAFCAACAKPLPAWQRGGSCPSGCDVSKPFHELPIDTLF